jgi:hypothetical protein
MRQVERAPVLYFVFPMTGLATCSNLITAW